MAPSELFSQRLEKLRQKLSAAGIDIAVITDDDSGYYGYLHMDFGRPTLLVVSAGRG